MGQVASSLASGMKQTMDENFKRQMEFQLNSFQMQLERQLAMQNEIRERQMSMQIARAREIVKYYGTFYALLAVGGTIGYLKRKTVAPLIPLFPLGFVLAFQLDQAYGNLMQRARAEAEQIMINERDLIKLPHDLPTFDLIEAKRLERKGQ